MTSARQQAEATVQAANAESERLRTAAEAVHAKSVRRPTGCAQRSRRR